MQDFTNSIIHTFQRTFDFTGLTGRRDYWYFFLFSIVVSVILSAIEGGLQLSFAILSLVFALATIIPSLAVAVRRLHDIGKSGWWMLLLFVPLIGVLVLLYWFVQPSKHEDNPYRLAAD